MIKTLYDDAQAVLAWIKQAPSSWDQYLLQERGYEVKALKQSTDLISIGRSQGKLEILDRLSGLKGELEDAVGKK